jgi:23S rRNA (cytosine1962-C5)-methyltransferase
MTDPTSTDDAPHSDGDTHAGSEIEANTAGYELLDAGVRRKLERFGPLTIDRPAPGADGFRITPGAWAKTDLRFDPGPGWSGPAWPVEPWPIQIAGLTMEIRPTDSGGVGLYPEHAANLTWLEQQIRERVVSVLPGRVDAASVETAAGAEIAVAPRSESSQARPQVLNLFAHTGLITLAMARAGAAVAHVDGARSAVTWGRRNARLSSLDDRPIRWLVDDAAAFVAREARRGRVYDGLVLDPPAFGRAGSREWRLEDDLPDLLAACRAIAKPDAFLLLTAHSEEVDGRRLGQLVRAAFRGQIQAVDVAPLDLTARSGAHLALGWSVRTSLRQIDSR